VIFYETRHHTQAHVISGTFIHCAFSLAARWTQMAPELGGWFCWTLLVMIALKSHNICCGCIWSSNQSGGGAILALSSFNQISHKKEPEISGGYIYPHMKIMVSSSWVLLHPESGKQCRGPLEVTSTRRIAVGHTIRIVDLTHVLVVLFRDVRFHRTVAVVTKISFCWWWVHICQHVNFSSVLPN